MADDALLAYRQTIEKRLLETIERHARADPTVDLARMVDRQIAEELARLNRLLEDEENPNLANVWIALKEWLPTLAKELKAGGYRSS